jgi:hypothetical protein
VNLGIEGFISRIQSFLTGDPSSRLKEKLLNLLKGVGVSSDQLLSFTASHGDLPRLASTNNRRIAAKEFTMSEPYIPSSDAGAEAWMEAFSEGIAANPALYGLSDADAIAISEAVQLFVDKFDVTKKAKGRNPVDIAAKDDARTAAEQICRQYAIVIKYNSGVSDPDKIDIGVRPVNPNRDPIHVPQSSPELSVIGSTPGSLTVHYKDPLTGKKRRPFGAANLQLFVAVADGIVTDPNQAKFVGAFTKSPVGLLFQPEDNNKQATMFGRWASGKGEVGPWSEAVKPGYAGKCG